MAKRPIRNAHIIGGGVAGLASAVFLIRDAAMAGENIHIFDEGVTLGGALDASGSPEAGYLMRGGRMFEEKFLCTYDLLSEIPSYDRPDVSARDDIFDFTRQASWDARTRLLDRDGEPIDVSSMGFDNRDRLALLALILSSERALADKTITQLLPPHFFRTNFWFMWRSMFGFQPWHSAVEMRRYLRRFVHLFPTLASMACIHKTRYNQYHSIIVPLQRWLRERGVIFETQSRVVDMGFEDDAARHRVTTLVIQHGATTENIALDASDIVIFANGSMVAAASIGANETAAALDRGDPGGAWALWKRIAGRRSGFGRPEAFCGDIDRSKWLTFTVTTRTPLLRKLFEEMTQRTLGREGLITFRDSSWLMTIKPHYHPVYPGQQEDVIVWWGYGLNPDKPGDFVAKRMADCSGEELMREALGHLHFDRDRDALIASSTAIPCMLPYITSQFMPRNSGDRPPVFPPGSVNIAFVGQFADAPQDVVFTVEYSVRTAKMAVDALVGGGPPSPVYPGWRNPAVLARALVQSFR